MEPDNKDGTFVKRLAILIHDCGGASSLARACNVSESVIRKWRDGKSEPTLSHLKSLAAAGSVDIKWLATGQGLKHHQPDMADEQLESYTVTSGAPLEFTVSETSLLAALLAENFQSFTPEKRHSLLTLLGLSAFDESEHDNKGPDGKKKGQGRRIEILTESSGRSRGKKR